MRNPILYEKFKNEDIDDAFIDACQDGNFEEVKYLLNSHDLVKNADIHAYDDLGFRKACARGHLDIARYLLTSPELEEHADMNACENESLKVNSTNGNLYSVKFMTSPEFKDKLKLDGVLEFFFKYVNQKNVHVAHYFIFDLNIERTESINKILKDYPDSKLEKAFALRDLNKELNTELSINKEIPKKVKI
jgi:hypothetical protein